MSLVFDWISKDSNSYVLSHLALAMDEARVYWTYIWRLFHGTGKCIIIVNDCLLAMLVIAHIRHIIVTSRFTNGD